MIEQKTTIDIHVLFHEDELLGHEVWFRKDEIIKLLDKYLLINRPLLKKAKELILNDLNSVVPLSPSKEKIPDNLDDYDERINWIKEHKKVK